MQLVTFQRNSSAEPGMLLDDSVLGLKAAGFGSMLDIIEQGDQARKRIQAWRAQHPAEQRLPLAAVRLLAPIPRPPKIICVGLSYRDHARECGADIPEVPTIFSKYSTAVLAPGAEIIIPAKSKQPDYEAEFAVVIGKGGRYISQDRWKEHVFGYTNLNDVSARDFQMATSQWMIGKTFDTFAPFGPAIVTADEIPDPHALKIQMIINGEVRQSSSTSEMVFRIPYLLEHISSVFTLEPGDIISTGTPAGVGEAKKPPRWLRPGDDVVVRISGIPELRNGVRAEA
jgi:2-keto-4-pentenoate hydratase/2-oxohepta-3-ene-1,7-dioic acid hydratase in catechol pathway